MSYTRGDNYIWNDEDGAVHFWTKEVDEGGSLLPAEVFDELVVMRYAELVAAGSVKQVEKQAIAHYEGNIGCQALYRMLYPGRPSKLDQTLKQATPPSPAKLNGDGNH